MSKTVVLAEKPSVGRDLARVLNCHKKVMVFLRRSVYRNMGIIPSCYIS